ncbi:MAG: fibronectin type III domain-containing protein [Capnocytophaga sp.]|uniref:fibronectin type III domain-containing protein n=1 Tax=Capnocytophaga sp. TaxID=44737 RepID=UPI003F9FD09B
MKRLLDKYFVHWLVLTLAGLLIVVSCSKDKKDEPEPPTPKVETPEHLKDWKPQPKVDTKQPYMAFATGSTSTTTLTLTAVGATDSATDVWVDTNNNGVFDEGVDKRITDFTTPITFTAASGVFTVYGKVKELTATGNALTAADVRSNAALTKLNVADNQLSEKALLNLVNSLPTATGTTAVVLRKAEGDGNKVTDAVLNTAKERGWQTLKTEGDKETTDLPTDTEAPTPAAINERITVTDQTATLSWETATDNRTSFDDLRYQVFWKAQGSTEVQNSGTPQAAMFSYKIEGLTPSTSYTVWVEVSDNANNKALYPEKTFTTEAKEETKPEPKDTHYIVLTTKKAVGETVKLSINAAEADKAGVWVDLNGNGKWDEGIDQKTMNFLYSSKYTLQAQTFRIYGKVWYLSCPSNQLNFLDISHNPALTELYAHENDLPSIAHLAHLKSLSIDTYTLKNSQLPKGLTYLEVNETEGAPLSTIDTSPFTELQILDVRLCKNLKTLDLSNNKNLEELFTYGTGLTELDLSHQPNLRKLNVSNTAFTKLNIAGNKALKVVTIKLTDKGEGLQGTALMDFLQQLPTYEKGKEGEIYLSPTQATEAVKNYLGSKFWLVNPKN